MPLLLPIPLLALCLLTVGISMVTSAAYVYYRDVPHLYELISFMIFVGTPVFYPLGIVSPAVRPFIQWTPISLAIEELRSIVILDRMPAPGEFPDACSLGDRHFPRPAGRSLTAPVASFWSALA